MISWSHYAVIFDIFGSFLIGILFFLIFSSVWHNRVFAMDSYMILLDFNIVIISITNIFSIYQLQCIIFYLSYFSIDEKNLKFLFLL